MRPNFIKKIKKLAASGSSPEAAVGYARLHSSIAHVNRKIDAFLLFSTLLTELSL